MGRSSDMWGLEARTGQQQALEAKLKRQDRGREPR